MIWKCVEILKIYCKPIAICIIKIVILNEQSNILTIFEALWYGYWMWYFCGNLNKLVKVQMNYFRQFIFPHFNCSFWEDLYIGQNLSTTRKHSSRIRTAGLLTGKEGGWCLGVVVLSRGWGVVLFRRGGVHNRTWYHNTPSPWTEWLTGVKALPCHKLSLRAVTMEFYWSFV